MSTAGVFIGAAVLAVGTYLIRIAGPILVNKVEMSPRTSALLDRAAIVLLVGVAMTGALFAGHEFVGWARPAGVAVGIIAALCRAPLVLVIILAAAVAAGLRIVGVA
ncbi:AzlD domain-containing protein [Gordonia sp. CPCC 206044]|uniref:AzlD domain-containing protein n=1 Tax=Gordonia sp. CPCC 206044 TaxID=3140793 RepID=UPI003AF373AA